MGSLRVRLFLLIVLPLVLLALLVGVWRVAGVWGTANEVFDRSLMFAALAVSRDVALLNGDAISRETERRLGETAGGPLRYHVFGPDGVLVIGYAVPPIPVSREQRQEAPFAYYDAIYKGDSVRMLRLRDESTIDGLSGTFTISVWQHFAARNAFAREQVVRAVAVLSILTIGVALLVWFGVRRGLRPLTDLEDAISQRSSEDLSSIRRPVPAEARGLVDRLNALFGQVRGSMDAQAAFVSDAAHQLRNPIAGLRALGESILTAPRLEDARGRARDLVVQATQASLLAERLLALQRAESVDGLLESELIDLAALMQRTVAKREQLATARGVNLSTAMPEGALHIVGDEILLQEALGNLVDNAFEHGGSELSVISVVLTRENTATDTTPMCTLSVSDDGVRVAQADVPKILARFGQVAPGEGSGLGLSIADAAARSHGGRLEIVPLNAGFTVKVVLPIREAA